MLKAAPKAILLISLFMSALCVLPFSSYAKDFKCPKDAKVIAQELLELQLSGYRLPERSSCLDQKNFKNILAEHDPDQEGSGDPDVSIDKSLNLQVSGVLSQGDLGEYDAVIPVTAELKKIKLSDNSEWPSELRFRFIAYKSETKIKESGCGSILSFLQKNIVWKNCLPLR